MLNERTEIFSNAIEGKLKVQSRANERLHDHIIEEIKEVEHERTEEALKMVQKKNDWWRYQNERDEARRLQGAGKTRKDEEMTWEPPRRKPDWLVREEARSREESKWRLEPEGEAEVPETFIVSDVIEGTNVDL